MPPIKDQIKAVLQWIFIGLSLTVLILLGLVVVPFSILTSKKRMNKFGELEQVHSARYKAKGSSGFWEYRASAVPFLCWFSNYEDGDLGEPSGKYSASRDGSERSFLSRYNWLALRNPVNMLKRTNPFFHCIIDECDIQYWGDHDVDDKGSRWGWQFVKATHRVTGKVYYGFRSTKDLGDGYCRQHRYGFKIKPGHKGEIQDADDKDKAFTFRLQWRSAIN